VRSTDH